MANLRPKTAKRAVIGLCQLTCTSNKAENFQTAKMLIERCKQRGAQVKWNKVILVQYVKKASLQNCSNYRENMYTNFSTGFNHLKYLTF